MPPARAAKYLSHITLALVHLHQHKIMYRDLKPENALIDEHDQCVLADFGLAKEMTSSCENRQTVTGTLGFMAPEIMQASYDFSVDIYALGITFLLTLLGEDAGELRYFKGRNVLLAPHHRDLPRIFKNHGDRLPPSALKLIRGHLVSESPSSRKPATSVSRSRFFTDFLGPDWKEKAGCASAASNDAEPAAEQVVEDDVQPDADDHSRKSGGTSELPDPTPEEIARRRGSHQAFLKRKSQEQQLRALAKVRFSPAVEETEVRI